MKKHISISEIDCPSADISAYLDGELSPVREMELDVHFAGCECCADELNLQKKFLIALDRALESEKEIELPANFTRIVVANAESNVGGLRRRSERYNAFFVCSGLFLIIIFALGASGSHTAFDTFFVVVEKVMAVGSFAAHVVYDIAIGAVAIIRSLSSHIVVEGYSIMTLLSSFSALCFYVISHFSVFI